MIISQSIDVDQPIDAVWKFFDDIPQVAACIPGADLTNKIAEDNYEGGVIISAGPVKLEFAGAAKVKERNNAKKTIALEASGSDKKGRGSASAILTASLVAISGGTKVNISLDLQISGAAAQYGRGLVSDVTAVLVNQTAENMKNRLRAISMGLDPNQVVGVKPASGLAIGMTATKRALVRVFNRFFLPYKPVARR
ncbi:MAG: SRPBCC family protein [Candidatus Nanopelagicaceae bacterium]|nr:SRPBCC family protein [Candidatus Nanopelagicaceae bacterium]